MRRPTAGCSKVTSKSRRSLASASSATSSRTNGLTFLPLGHFRPARNVRPLPRKPLRVVPGARRVATRFFSHRETGFHCADFRPCIVAEEE